MNFANYFYGQTFFHSDKIILLWSAIVFLVFIYFVLEPRLLIAPFILINAFLSEENMSIGEAYRKTRDKYWTALLYEIIPSAVAGFRVLFISYIYQTDISFYVKTIDHYITQ